MTTTTTNDELFGYGLRMNRDGQRPSMSIRFKALSTSDIARLESDYDSGADERERLLEEARDQRAVEVSKELYAWYENNPDWNWYLELQKKAVLIMGKHRINGTGVTGKTLLDLDSLKNEDDDILLG